jgi:hypothetical protein
MPVHNSYGISLTAHDEEAELGVAVCTEDRPKGVPVISLWPAKHAALELADVVRIHGMGAPRGLVQVIVDQIGQLLTRQWPPGA